ncbi:PHD family toxin-antitoxin system [Lactobacillus iners]|uniref:PHD family toxin-antitoxin system n=1 Tax=Lactobacillus iners TaxID=147802 RepID=UPI000C9BF453|nr:PHD family toxin-antitoxin system [Lactobacillus iners]MCT7678657.1 PHD family toxin-antitoxin system [Lactobacillus iners]MCT7825171.1 PHD family toxin-antitoxin system [Lactobacillus iners]MCT7855674.1 PHD family toxin-antitoxin system [Lactobacillus iners]PMC28973.1 PHD family toxin-antitoxin system [Lactobacillus iners]
MRSTIKIIISIYIITDEQETIYIPRPKQKSVALISQDRIDWLEKYAQSEPGTLKHSIAGEHLTEMDIILEQCQRISTNEDYNKFWKQFK